jgi:hypothetical protein
MQKVSPSAPSASPNGAVVRQRAAAPCKTVRVATHDDGSDRRPSARIVFELDVAAGWPPVGAERVWAHALGADRYVIDNPPWFVPDLAVGDIVRAVPPDPRAHPVFQELLHRSDHVTLRLVCFRGGPLGGDLDAAKAPFTRLGVYAEGSAQFGMLALDVTPADPLEQLIAVLRAGVADGSWEFEEGRVTQWWIEATSP